MTDRNATATAFVTASGWSGARAITIAGDASNRSYQRLSRTDGATAIFMDAPPERGEDVGAFVRMARYLVDQGLSAPRILAQDTDHGFLLIEDLGDDLFARLLVRDTTRQTELYTAATDVLLALHKAPTLPLEPCDADWLLRMTDLPFEWYAAGDASAAFGTFKALFRPLAETLDETAKVVALRDYHAENLLWLPDRQGVARVGLLDFQDALLAHPAYDLVSVLQDARRNVSPEVEEAMITRYFNHSDLDAEAFRRAYALLGTQRNLRIVGIFARLCLRDGKAHYVDKIPRVWAYVMRNLQHPDLAEVARLVTQTLPQPTTDVLNNLKARCASAL